MADGKSQKVKVGTSDNLVPGDWVLYTGDYLIKKIDEAEATEIFELLSGYEGLDVNALDEGIEEIIMASRQRDLTGEEIARLLEIEGEKQIMALGAEANILRKESIRDHICIHGIIEFSNHCANDCHYCGLRRSNAAVKRYRMEPQEIIDAAVEAVNGKGYKILVLQSGDDHWYDEEKLVEIVKGIKEKARVFIYLSIGDRPTETYRKLKEAGANGVLYRFETSDHELYSRLHPGKLLKDRIEAMRRMKEMGYVISTGMIIGLPGQTTKTLADDIMLMKELGTFMPSMGPLIPSANTPLSDSPRTSLDLILKIIAVTRLVMPKARISVTTAMETLGGDSVRQKCFMAGANSVMFNLTPEKYRSDYCIYDDKFFDNERKYERWALFKGEQSYEMMEEELQIEI